MTTIEAVKQLLDLIIHQEKDLPLSECDTPHKENGYMVTHTATLDFRKGIKHCVNIIKQFIEDCEKEESEGEK
jgi:hypothetical protein